MISRSLLARSARLLTAFTRLLTDDACSSIPTPPIHLYTQSRPTSRRLVNREGTPTVYTQARTDQPLGIGQQE